MNGRIPFGNSRRLNGEVTWGLAFFPLMVIYFFCVAIIVFIVFIPLPLALPQTILISAAGSFILAMVMDIVYPISNTLAKITVAKLLKRDTSVSPLTEYFKLKNARKEGYIYMVRRFSDGVYKIGKTNDFRRRFSGLSLSYGPVYAIALWEVPSCREAERVALEMTLAFAQRGSRHKELRMMNDEDAKQFMVKFTEYVLSVDKR